MKKIIMIAGLVSLFPYLAFAQSTTQSGSDSGSVAVANIYGDEGSSSGTVNYPRNTPAPTAPAFVVSSPCMGVASGSGTTPGFGISIGMSYKDNECEERANAAALSAMNMQAAAIQELCQTDSIKKAMAAANTPCNAVVSNVSAVSSTVNTPATSTSQTSAPNSYVISNGTPVPVTSERDNFCKGLNPKKSEDVPYIKADCS
jgi:hypothetical protein